MPTILIQEGCQLLIFFNDHAPAHVHVNVGDGTVVIEIETGDVLKKFGRVKQSEIAKARRVVANNKELVTQKWNEIHPPTEK